MEKLSDAQLDKAFETLREAVLAQPGAPKVLTQLDEETNPLPDRYPDRPAVWSPSVTLSAAPEVFEITSLDKYQWGPLTTAQKFPLPELPLEKGTLGEEVLRSITWTPGFPSEDLKVSRGTDGRLQVVTYGAHGQFNYKALLTEEDLSQTKERYSFIFYPWAEIVVGFGVIHMDRRRAIWLPEDYRVDLEAQLVEGTLALGADLLDKAVDPESPVAWPALIQDLRGRVELRRQSMLNDRDSRGDLIPQGEQLLYLASRR